MPRLRGLEFCDYCATTSKSMKVYLYSLLPPHVLHSVSFSLFLATAAMGGLSGREELTVLSNLHSQWKTALIFENTLCISTAMRVTKVLHMARFLFDFSLLGEFFSLAFLMMAIYRSLLSLSISRFLDC